MAEISAVQSSESRSAAAPARPYAPSWFDHFTDWIDRLPFSAPVFYLGWALVLIVAQLLIQQNTITGTIYPFPIVFLLTLPYDLALIHYLDKAAAFSLTRFRPMLSVTDGEYDDLRYRLTTLPARHALLATIIGGLFGITTLEWVPYASQVNEFHFIETPLSIHFNHFMAIPIWAIVALVLYHTFHQLRVVQQIYDRSSFIDLYNLRPLYAFSSLSAQTAVGVGSICYVWYLLAPTLFEIGVSGLALFTAISLLTFILPLRGAHRLLDEEKAHRLRDNGELSRSVIAELHRRVAAGELVAMDELNKTMTSLDLERATLERVSTWPWRPETSRVVAAAVFFPVVVWLLQWVLERVLT